MLNSTSASLVEYYIGMKIIINYYNIYTLFFLYQIHSNTFLSYVCRTLFLQLFYCIHELNRKIYFCHHNRFFLLHSVEELLLWSILPLYSCTSVLYPPRFIVSAIRFPFCESVPAYTSHFNYSRKYHLSLLLHSI